MRVPHQTRLTGALALFIAAALAGCSLPQTKVEVPEQQAQAASASGAVPTPTFVPVGVQPPSFETGADVPASPAASDITAPPAGTEPIPPATDAPPARDEPIPPATDAPPAGAEPIPSTFDQLLPPTPRPTPPSVVAGAESLRLDDDAWYGGWKQGKPYGGRSATWIYGSGTEYSTMEAAFELTGQPGGEALLGIEGMDGENAPKMQISILVNGVAVYTGPNLLPDDDHVLETGTWATFIWGFDAAFLQPGVNTITIIALSPGSFGQPPFLMLDYADLTIDG